MTDADKSDDVSWILSIARGFRRRCPRCGRGKLFTHFLRVTNTCELCGLELSQTYRADDGPAFFTMSLVLFILAPLLLWLDIHYNFSLPILIFIFLPLTVAITLSLLPRVKGAFVAASWKAKLRDE